MISTSKNFLFVHVPKTGGNSIQNILNAYSDDRLVITAPHQDGVERFEIKHDRYAYHKHSNLFTYKKLIEPKIYRNMFKFSVVRNPWDRMVSYYFSPHRNIKEFNREDFKHLISKIPVLAYYTAEISNLDRVKNKLNLFRGKNHDLLGSIDFYLRFENLNQDFEILSEKLNISFQNLPRYNQSERKHYSYYYDDELINLVGRKFKEEIALFNYNFET